LASFRKIHGLPISKTVRTADSTIIIITNFYLAASSHEIFLMVGGREGIKGLGALQRHQLPHPPCKNPGSATAFKVPVGYFLIDGLGGTERANLVHQFLSKLHEVGITVISLTFDGSAANLAMANHLGCKLDVLTYEFVTSFKHPLADYNVSLFLDPCHMLKLVRNTLGDKKSVVDGSGDIIKWDYITNLHKLQEQEGLHFGNR